MPPGPHAPELFLRHDPDGRLALGVRDFGPGVPEAQLAPLTQAFYRPDSARTREGGGVGLGLYLCRLVAQAHGGELRLRNAALEVAMVWPPRTVIRQVIHAPPTRLRSCRSLGPTGSKPAGMFRSSSTAGPWDRPSCRTGWPAHVRADRPNPAPRRSSDRPGGSAFRPAPAGPRGCWQGLARFRCRRSQVGLPCSTACAPSRACRQSRRCNPPLTAPGPAAASGPRHAR
jgi:hypothetical protein